MSLRRDERAVTVQIGAVLLLAIVFAALALYQVNVVPAENGAVESEHNQQIHGEMQELRNAVKNAGTKGDSTSVSVTLGTRYPSRTFLTNPPNPTGTLETGESGTVRIDNANFEGTYTGNPGALLGTDYETRPIHYEPSYNEYRSAPTTRIEHGFAFNDFGEASVGLTKQPLIDDERITIVLVEGDLSTSSSGATTVDTRVLSGPTDPINLESTGDNITITVPTQSPNAWNKTIGTEFGTESGQAKAKVTGYTAGELTIELEDDPNAEYELQMARVKVGDSETSRDPDEFDITDSQSDSNSNSTSSSGAYDVRWNTSRTNNANDRVSCTMDGCTFTATDIGDTAPVYVETEPLVDDATVEYAVSNNDIATFDPGSGTVQNGEHMTTIEARSNGTITGFASSGGAGDRLDVTVQIESNGSTELPDGRIAYHDQNDNGAYDDSEPTYSESDLRNLNVAGSLIVADDAFSSNGMDITAERLTIEDGTRLETRNGGIQLATSSGELVVAGTLDTTLGSGQPVTLDAAGETILSDARIRSSGTIDISSTGPIDANDATLDASDASYGSITVSGDDSITIQRAVVLTQGPISVSADASLDATAADFDSTGIGQEISHESRGDMTLDRTTISVGQYGTMTGDLGQGSRTLYVDSAEFRQNGNSGTFDYSPNGVNVVGVPAVGSAS